MYKVEDYCTFSPSRISTTVDLENIVCASLHTSTKIKLLRKIFKFILERNDGMRLPMYEESSLVCTLRIRSHSFLHVYYFPKNSPEFIMRYAGQPVEISSLDRHDDYTAIFGAVTKRIQYHTGRAPMYPISMPANDDNLYYILESVEVALSNYRGV